MANLPEANEYPAGIYQIETTDPVLGGPPNEATKAGLTNIPPMQLAKRTNWLKARVDQLLSTVVAGTTLVAGLVRLSSAVNSTSETEAATSRAVKIANDNAESRALKTTVVSLTGLATGGGNLGANISINVPDATQAEAESGTVTTRAMSPLRVAQAIAARLAARSITASGLASGGGNLSQNRDISVPIASQTDAETGTANDKAMTPLRVFQAVANRMAQRQITVAGGIASGGGPLSGNVTITVPAASQAEAEAGASTNRAMSPLRVAQAMARWGLGTQSPPFVENCNDALTSGLYRVGANTPNAPETATMLLRVESFSDSGQLRQWAMRHTAGATYTRYRTLEGSWSQWEIVWTSSPVSPGLGATDYYRLPSGLILQWGVIDAGAGGMSSVTFPTTFPNSCLLVVATDYNGGTLSSSVEPARVATGEYTRTGFKAYQWIGPGPAVSGASRYFAIGV